MARVFIVNHLKKALAASTFAELWNALTNDQAFDASQALKATTGRDLDPSFHGATQEDWEAMRALLENLDRAADELNSVVRDLNWENSREVAAAMTEARRSAAGKTAEYTALIELLTKKLENFGTWEHPSDFGEYRLFDLKVIPELPPVDESPHDVFVSYKTSREKGRATALVRDLRELGYKVWFDGAILDQMPNRPKKFEKEHLISILTKAVASARCTIVFEGVLHAVELTPDTTEEETLARRTTLLTDEGDFVAFDWQVLEISATSRGIAIHPKTVTAFEKEAGQTKWTSSFGYTGDAQLLLAIQSALHQINVQPSSR
jgi:hypothetical protein